MISTSSSNWLDRLRSSRGFPTGNEPDLDRFISLSSSSGSAESATHVTREKPPKWTPPPGEFASVLSDLFNMGGDVSKASIKRKKACRKQSNPRFFNVETELRRSSSSVDGRQNGGFALSGDNSLDAKQLKTDDGNYYDSCTNKIAKLRVENVNDEDDVVVVVENEEAENGADDLREYSRSEVTVIDTSFEEWKSDKWVFRKNDEWKIKEKKMKRSRILKSKLSGGGNNSNSNNNNNKRKLLVSDLGNNNNTSNNNNNINDNDNNNNKLEGDNDDDQLLMKKKNKKNEEDELPNKRQSRNDKGRESFQKRQAYLGKVPQKRFPCPRPPEKVRNEASPVILIKSIPLNDNTAAMKTGKTSQKIRPKKMKII